jgi:hypothetical protein
VIFPRAPAAKRRRKDGGGASAGLKDGKAAGKQVRARIAGREGGRGLPSRRGVDKPRPLRRRAWSARRERAILPMSKKRARMMDEAWDAYTAGLESARAAREAAEVRGDAIGVVPVGEEVARSRGEIARAARVDALRKSWPVPVHMRARRGRFLVAMALVALASAREEGGGKMTLPAA